MSLHSALVAHGLASASAEAARDIYRADPSDETYSTMIAAYRVMRAAWRAVGDAK